MQFLVPLINNRADFPSLRVEFLGAPGIGKTTLCNEVLREFSKNPESWIGIQSAHALSERVSYLELLETETLSERIKTALRVQRHGVFKLVIDGFPNLHFLNKALEERKDLYVREFLESHHIVFEGIAQYWFDPEGRPGPLAIRYLELLRYLRHWLFSLKAAGERCILADNARVTRGIAELIGSENSNQRRVQTIIQAFFACPLVPDALIHFTGDPGLVLQRIKQRERQLHGLRHPGHIDKSDDQLFEYTTERMRVNSLAVERFSKEGVRVLELEASSAPHENMKNLINFLERLRGDKPIMDG